jgi:cytochrome-b5 reductase
LPPVVNRPMPCARIPLLCGQRILCYPSSQSVRQCISLGRRGYVTTTPRPTAPSRYHYTLASLVAALTGLAAYGYSVLNTGTPERMGPGHFTKLRVCNIQKVTPDTSIFQLCLPPELLPSSDSPSGPISAIALVQPDLQIQRPYTPLDMSAFDEKTGRGVVDLLVKKYDAGEVSRWLHTSVRVGDELLVRGPLQTWKYEPARLDELFLVRLVSSLPRRGCISRLS